MPESVEFWKIFLLYGILELFHGQVVGFGKQAQSNIAPHFRKCPDCRIVERCHHLFQDFLSTSSLLCFLETDLDCGFKR